MIGMINLTISLSILISLQHLIAIVMLIFLLTLTNGESKIKVNYVLLSSAIYLIISKYSVY